MKFLSKSYSLSDFFYELNKRKINYVVLRWFENIESLESQKDIDLLVTDEHFESVNHFLVNEPTLGGTQVDLYGLSSNNGYNKTTYYPYALAKRIIDSRIPKGNLYVPNSKIHLLSFIFHVVFHKAENSGISISVSDCLDNKYAKEIRRIASFAKYDLPKEINLVTLSEILSDNEWLPPVDWLRKSSSGRSIYVNTFFPGTIGCKSRSIFILRNVANEGSIHMQITNLLVNQNFKLIKYEVLDSNQAYVAQKSLRGGNWGKGPYELEGGVPYSVYVLEDANPEPVSDGEQGFYPYLINSRFLSLKNKIRELVEKTLNIGSVNCVHSTDDELEFLEYYNLLFPVGSSKVNLYGGSRRTDFSIVDFNGHLAIQKKFKPGFEKYYKRELEAYLFLQKSNFPFLPNLLSYSDNSLIIELIHFDKNRQNKLLSNKLNIISSIPKLLWRLGCAHLDLHPGNCLVDIKDDIYILDYEQFYKYEHMPLFEDSYDLVGHPDSKAWGIKGENPAEFINLEWKRTVGYRLTEIVQLTAKELSV
jgi:hypothetical protein